VSIPRFSVDEFRVVDHPLIVLRHVDVATIVLGSTQDESLINASSGVEIVRRRGGGGAVFLDAQCVTWIDLWIPRDDPCHRSDVQTAMVLIGELFRDALGQLGVHGATVLDATHRVTPSAVCFASSGPGEVMIGSNKIVGMTAWRGREGALFQTALYQRQPAPLHTLLAIPEREPTEAVATLASLGIEDFSGESLAAELASALRLLGSKTPEITHAGLS